MNSKHLLLTFVLGILSLSLSAQINITGIQISGGTSICNPLTFIGNGITFCAGYSFNASGGYVSNDTIFLEYYFNGPGAICAGVLGQWFENVIVPVSNPGSYHIAGSVYDNGAFADNHFSTVTVGGGCCDFVNTTVTACDSFVSGSGQVYTASGTYTNVLTNQANCDSTVTYDLTIASATSGSGSAFGCGSVLSPSGNYVWTTSGIYNDTLMNADGCDSIITMDVTLSNPVTVNVDVFDCESYTSPLGNVYTSSGVYNDTLMASTGCDSIVVANVTIEDNGVTNLSLEACEATMSFSGNVEWTATGMYPDTVMSANGCDSILMVDFTLKEVDVMVAQLLGAPGLMATATNATFQWVDCNDNFAVVSGATNAEYAENGSFAVIVTQNGCVDTSMCYDVAGVGINDTWNGPAVSLYPNPSEASFSLEFEENLSNFSIEIYNISGEIISARTYDNTSSVVIDQELVSGVYLVKVLHQNESKLLKMVRK